MTETKTEVISPEGVEEQLVEEFTFRITLTLGGKYRTYVKLSEKSKWYSEGISDTKKEAEKNLGMHMAVAGNMMIDANKTIEKLISYMIKINNS